MKNFHPFTITKTTPRGVQEVLTIKGFRSREVVKRDKLEIKYFEKSDAWALVHELREAMRDKKAAKSINVNYS